MDSEITPRTRTYRDKAQRTGIIDRTKEKEAAKHAAIERIEMERKLLDSYIKDDRLDFAGLPVLEPSVRDTFLTWLSKALEKKDRSAKTEDGRNYFIEEHEGQVGVENGPNGNLPWPAK